jgi:transposase
LIDKKAGLDKKFRKKKYNFSNNLEVAIWLTPVSLLLLIDVLKPEGKLIKWVCKNNPEKIIFCLEHTGIYSLPVCSQLSLKNISYTLISAAEIKKSIGVRRGKNDKADAKDIATYAYLHRDIIKITQVPERTLLKLRILLTQREKLVKTKVMFDNTKEIITFTEEEVNKYVKRDSKAVLKFLIKRIELIDSQIEDLILSNENMKRVYLLMKSIPGIGLQISANIIAYTGCFTWFDCSRKFACYSGIAPFQYQSGSSIKGKTKVSPLANKKMKSLL